MDTANNAVWDRIVMKKSDVVSREIAGETILVPVRGTLVDLQRIWSLNPVAGCIWQMLDGQHRLGEIRDRILASFAVEKEEADSDIREFISELFKEGLVVG